MIDTTIKPLTAEKVGRAPLTIALLWAAILAGTITAFIVTILLLNSFIYSPKAQVALYLNALKEGNSDTALTVLNASIPADSKSNALLSPEVVKQSTSKLENIAIHDGTPTNTRNTAHVDVHYEVESKPFSTTFVLENSGKQAIFFDNWNIVPHNLPVIEAFIPNRQSATIDDTVVHLPGGQSTFAVFYPGVYEGKSASRYLYSPPVNTVVSSSKNSRMVFDFKATAELNDVITKETSTFLQQCTQQKVLAPTGCPFSHLKTKDRVTGSTIEWSIVGEPTFKLETQDENWVVVITGAARITAATTDLYTGARNTLDAVENFSYTALLRVNGDRVTMIHLEL